MAGSYSKKGPNAGRTSDRSVALQRECGCDVVKMKDRQSRKIRELKHTLVAAGFVTLDEQARVLGLCRSSAWSVLKGNHKNSGLSVATINRLLRTPQLPSAARAKILEYVEEKASGLYGHSRAQLRRFVAQLSKVGWPKPCWNRRLHAPELDAATLTLAADAEPAISPETGQDGPTLQRTHVDSEDVG